MRRSSSANVICAIATLFAVTLPALLFAGVALSATPEGSRRPARAKPPAQDVAPPPAQKPAPQNPTPIEPPPVEAPQKPPAENAAPPPRASADVDPASLQPYNLPPASRQRMRTCGERWRDLKSAGKSAGLTWRSFAEKCLPGQD
jgi:hypothetical protein